MLSATKLFEAKQNARAYMSLQQSLHNINDITYHEVSTNLLQSDYISNSDRIEELLHLLIEAIDQRPKNVSHYVKLTQDIISILPEFQNLLHDSLLSTFDRKSSRMFYLYQLQQLNIISINDILNCIKILFRDRAFQYMKIHRKFTMILFYWYSPEFSKDEALFNEILEAMKEVHNSPYFRTLTDLNNNYLNDYDYLSANNWEKHKIARSHGMSYDPIALSIANNDINSLTAISEDHFNVNGVILPSVFESCQFLHHFPTYLQYAAYHGSKDVFFWLIEHGADRLQTDQKNRRVEDYAIVGGHPEIVGFLLKDYQEHQPVVLISERSVRNTRKRRNNAYDIGAERTFTGCSSRTQKRFAHDQQNAQTGSQKSISTTGYSNYAVAKFNRLNIIPLQIDETVFFEACKKDCVELVIFAIENGMDPNLTDKNNSPAISIACQYGNIEIVKFLAQTPEINLSARDQSGGTPLCRAASYCHLPVVRYLCAQESVNINDGDERGTTAFVFSAMKGNLKMVEFLSAQKGVDLNAMDEYYGPAYLHAAMHGHLDVLKFLSTKEKNGLLMQGDYVTFSIIYAANKGYIDIIKFLKTKDGVDLNLKNIYDENVLTSAASGHQLETLKYLATIDGIDLNQKGPNGNSAFCQAAVIGDLEIIKYLSKLPGVDIHHTNNYDANALNLAISNKNMEIAEFLKGLGLTE
ncbi:hypothetical protein TRFO_25383 [Tritrichomonas foetus]|uniref:DUF3447 domain-containing protein n=1 Tax=Tritrichomonas foetus TaxID=1144522 RepID=A0A1J4K6P9_9EUKA|nr:hypothetical protein TRFO_25383 [Tritrichomonas foetus]|eukprot:OHT06568.1 hypothetical protein TRFO_25383 [Tritrichomonas foetus]